MEIFVCSTADKYEQVFQVKIEHMQLFNENVNILFINGSKEIAYSAKVLICSLPKAGHPHGQKILNIWILYFYPW